MRTQRAALGAGAKTLQSLSRLQAGRCRRVLPDMVIATQSQCMERAEEAFHGNVVIAPRAGDP